MEERVKRYREVNRFWYVMLVVFSSVAIVIAIDWIFHVGLLHVMLAENSYLYALLLVYLSPVFILFPATKSAPRDKIPWYDIMLFLVSISCFGYLTANGANISLKGWAIEAPAMPTVMSFLIWALVLEGIRRTTGLVLVMMCLFFSLYPVFAGHMPGCLFGYTYPVAWAARSHMMGTESLLGIPVRVLGTLVIGFMIFGIAMMHTGGGKFLTNLSFALLGSTRGGPAKVAVFASALFGSISGSPVANVLTTGSMTIPAMKRTGYPPQFAGAVEACASSGGVLMPPVMGSAAFIMASFLGVPYIQVAKAAVIPSVLYYLSLFMQIDARAVKLGLKGIPKSEVPSLKQTMKGGWFYVFAFAALIYFLIYLKVAAWAPWPAIGLLLAMAMFKKETRFTLRSFFEFIAGTGKLMGEITTIMAGVGLIMGGLAITGVAGAFSRELVLFAHGNMMLLLALGALTSFILGMGMTLSAVYVFLAMVMVPALIQMGLNVFAVHLFVMYWAMISAVTPPVAVAAYAGATIAGSPPMKTGFTAMRLATVIYILPFLFVLDPSLVGQAPIIEILHSFSTCAIGIILIATALEGYLVGLGRLSIPLRVLALASGILLALPGWRFDCIGLVAAGVLVLLGLLQRKALRKGIPG